jgi:hypothetical protein
MWLRRVRTASKLSLSDLRQAVYKAYDSMLDSAKEVRRVSGRKSIVYEERFVREHRRACEAYRAALRHAEK